MNSAIRGNAYKLLGRLLLGEPRALEQAREIEPFRSMLEARSDDDIASEHQRLFGHELYPFAGVFTEASALVGGRIACRVGHVATRGGVDLDSSDSLDHIGNIMVVIGELLHRGSPKRATELRDECLIGWLPPWAAVLERRGGPFWKFVVELVLELVLEEPPEAPASLLSAPLEVTDRMGATAVAAALTRPAVVGAFLSIGDIRDIGRRLELPTGFGARQLMLSNLFRSAAEYERPRALLAALAMRFRADADLMVARFPAPLAEPWGSRARTSAKTLEDMGQRLASTPGAVSYG